MNRLASRLDRREQEGCPSGILLLVADEAEARLAADRPAPGIKVVIVHTGMGRGPAQEVANG
jgi:hypothetical protein